MTSTANQVRARSAYRFAASTVPDTVFGVNASKNLARFTNGIGTGAASPAVKSTLLLLALELIITRIIIR